MPYRGDVPPFSFAGIHTACICGDNGNGKSALIDAITWALWGKTRTEGTKISDDALIHQGEPDMEVEFEFAVADQIYRVIRKHARPRGRSASGQSSLDLFIADDEGYKVISGDTLRQTQHKIISLLNMDYDTFINSAFLRQGHADEFTQQPPAKRKEVLASILQLSLYDHLEERARELGRGLTLEKAQLENSIRDTDLELEKKAGVEAELAQAQVELKHLDKEIAEQQKSLDGLRQQKQSLENQRQQLAQLEEHAARTTADLESWRSSLEQRLERIQGYQKLIARRQDIENGYRQLTEARRLNDELNEKLRRLHKLNDSRSRLEREINQAQAKLLADHAVVQNSLAELEVTVQKLPHLKKDLAALDGDKARLEQMQKEMEDTRQWKQELLSAIQEIESRLKLNQQEVQDTREKLKLLQGQCDAACPLCETKLGPEGIEVITAKYNTRLKNLAEEIAGDETESANKKAEYENVTGEVSRLEVGLNKERLSLQDRTSRISHAIDDTREATARLEQEKERLDEIETSLNSKDFAPQVQQALAAIESEINQLDYDATRHEQAGQQVAQLQDYEAQQHRLAEADRLLQQEQVEVVRAKETMAELEKRLTEDAEKKKSLAAGLEALPDIEKELQEAESAYSSLAASQRQAQEAAGSLKGRLEHFKQQEDKRKERRSRLACVADEESVYGSLATAFGKRGIQAMLIETALPEIETEANRLLGRMTDNRMHVKLEAQRQSKKGEPIETLDIIIADELGARPYETFSGGEAFRIDFALRIALSRLLAKRAGAPLPTLIIDEGFGTQDSAGIEKLKEAINSIKDSFDKIIVITHMEELKDAFPTRINVVKTAEGSTLEVA